MLDRISLLWKPDRGGEMIGALTLAIAATKGGVIRHTTYTFGITVTTTDTRHTSGIGRDAPISGQSVSSSSESDEGTITADVVGLRPDTGIVVRVKEDRKKLSAVPSADCIVWGVGTVVCQPGAEVTTEERALLRYLGRNFINSAMIDVHGNWKMAVNSKDYQESTSYSIAEPQSEPLEITFQRVSKSGGPQGFNATTDGKLLYNADLTIPLTLHEDTLLRTHLIDGDVVQGGYEEVRTAINLQLADDSMGAAAPQKTTGSRIGSGTPETPR